MLDLSKYPSIGGALHDAVKKFSSRWPKRCKTAALRQAIARPSS
jgi:hypothetical protein